MVVESWNGDDAGRRGDILELNEQLAFLISRISVDHNADFVTIIPFWGNVYPDVLAR